MNKNKNIIESRKHVAKIIMTGAVETLTVLEREIRAAMNQARDVASIFRDPRPERIASIKVWPTFVTLNDRVLAVEYAGADESCEDAWEDFCHLFGLTGRIETRDPETLQMRHSKTVKPERAEVENPASVLIDEEHTPFDVRWPERFFRGVRGREMTVNEDTRIFITEAKVEDAVVGWKWKLLLGFERESVVNGYAPASKTVEEVAESAVEVATMYLETEAARMFRNLRDLRAKGWTLA